MLMKAAFEDLYLLVLFLPIVSSENAENPQRSSSETQISNAHHIRTTDNRDGKETFEPKAYRFDIGDGKIRIKREATPDYYDENTDSDYLYDDLEDEEPDELLLEENEINLQEAEDQKRQKRNKKHKNMEKDTGKEEDENGSFISAEGINLEKSIKNMLQEVEDLDKKDDETDKKVAEVKGTPQPRPEVDVMAPEVSTSTTRGDITKTENMSDITSFTAEILTTMQELSSTQRPLQSSEEKLNSTEVYVQRGDKVLLACLNEEKNFVSQIDPSYAWVGPDENPVATSSPRFQMLETGNLQINDVQPMDAGNYVCLATGRTEVGKFTVNNYLHNLTVFVPPHFAYDVTMRYSAPSCDDKKMYDKAAKIKVKLCQEEPCEFVVKQRCHAVRNQNTMSHELWVEIRQGLHAGYELPKCSPQCTMSAAYAALDKKYTKIKDLFQSEIKNTEHNFNFLENKYSKKNSSACDDGFQKKSFTLCIPCPPGTYNDKGGGSCVQCPLGEYQENYGRAQCLPCPANQTTRSEGTTSTQLCLGAGFKFNFNLNFKTGQGKKDLLFLTGISLLAVVLALIILYLIIRKCCKKYQTDKQAGKTEEAKETEAKSSIIPDLTPDMSHHGGVPIFPFTLPLPPGYPEKRDSQELLNLPSINSRSSNIAVSENIPETRSNSERAIGSRAESKADGPSLSKESSQSSRPTNRVPSDRESSSHRSPSSRTSNPVKQNLSKLSSQVINNNSPTHSQRSSVENRSLRSRSTRSADVIHNSVTPKSPTNNPEKQDSYYYDASFQQIPSQYSNSAYSQQNWGKQKQSLSQNIHSDNMSYAQLQPEQVFHGVTSMPEFRGSVYSTAQISNESVARNVESADNSPAAKLSRRISSEGMIQQGSFQGPTSPPQMALSTNNPFLPSGSYYNPNGTSPVMYETAPSSPEGYHNSISPAERNVSTFVNSISPNGSPINARASPEMYRTPPSVPLPPPTGRPSTTYYGGEVEQTGPPAVPPMPPPVFDLPPRPASLEGSQPPSPLMSTLLGKAAMLESIKARRISSSNFASTLPPERGTEYYNDEVAPPPVPPPGVNPPLSPGPPAPPQVPPPGTKPPLPPRPASLAGSQPPSPLMSTLLGKAAMLDSIKARRATSSSENFL